MKKNTLYTYIIPSFALTFILTGIVFAGDVFKPRPSPVPNNNNVLSVIDSKDVKEVKGTAGLCTALDGCGGVLVNHFHAGMNALFAKDKFVYINRFISGQKSKPDISIGGSQSTNLIASGDVKSDWTMQAKTLEHSGVPNQKVPVCVNPQGILSLTCPPPPPDYCLNIEGVQTQKWYDTEGGSILFPVRQNGNCLPNPIVGDECINIFGTQSSIPSGYTQVIRDGQKVCIVPSVSAHSFLVGHIQWVSGMGSLFSEWWSNHRHKQAVQQPKLVMSFPDGTITETIRFKWDACGTVSGERDSAGNDSRGYGCFLYEDGKQDATQFPLNLIPSFWYNEGYRTNVNSYGRAFIDINQEVVPVGTKDIAFTMDMKPGPGSRYEASLFANGFAYDVKPANQYFTLNKIIIYDVQPASAKTMFQAMKREGSVSIEVK